MAIIRYLAIAVHAILEIIIMENHGKWRCGKIVCTKCTLYRALTRIQRLNSVGENV